MGVAEATPKGKKKKKKKKKEEKNGFGILGVAGPPPRAWGWLQTPPRGGSSHPDFSHLFFFFIKKKS
jgi:hypothetical protein